MLLYGVGQVALTSASDTHGTTIDLHKGRNFEALDDLSDVLGFYGPHERPVCSIFRHVNFAGNHCVDAENVNNN